MDEIAKKYGLKGITDVASGATWKHVTSSDPEWNKKLKDFGFTASNIDNPEETLGEYLTKNVAVTNPTFDTVYIGPKIDDMKGINGPYSYFHEALHLMFQGNHKKIYEMLDPEGYKQLINAGITDDRAFKHAIDNWSIFRECGTK
jgi:hypothetical protein